MHVYTTHHPIGVVAAIVPWNAQMFLTATKLAPALAAGCSVILKASEIAPCSLFELAKLIKLHNVHYHQNDKPIISDGEFDKLVNENSYLEKKYPDLIQKNGPNDAVGSKLKNKFNKGALHWKESSPSIFYSNNAQLKYEWFVSENTKNKKRIAEEQRKKEQRIAEEQRKKDEEKRTAEKKKPKEIIPAASGSGFFVSKSGHIITNYHVVEGCNDKSKIMYNDKEYSAKLLASDKKLDVALLKADLKNKGYLKFSYDPKKMQKIYQHLSILFV